MSDHGHQGGGRTGAAERTHRYRARRKAGERWVPGFDVSREVLECLIAEGWTTEEEASDPQKLSDVIADFLDVWARDILAADQ